MASTGTTGANVLLDSVMRWARLAPDAPAFSAASCQDTTYAQLWDQACVIARGLDAHLAGRGPVLVLGRKTATTVASFLACLMSGHAYVPVDVSLPARRVHDIAGQIEGAACLAACELPEELAPMILEPGYLDARQLLVDAEERGLKAAPLPRERWVSGEETQYIIFTSGTTGRPKGIEVTAANVARFSEWLREFPQVREGGRVFLDQAHYSFDLSEFELVGALVTGGCLHAVDEGECSDFRALFDDLSRSGVQVWVSTPSFADLCLVDKSFDQRLLPNLRLFLFCGETLHHTTAAKLRERFPQAVVANTYGPTESTVAVTYCQIGEKELADPTPLPVGRPRRGTELRVVDHQTGEPVPAGQTGEIVIVGDTVARGYWQDPQKTQAAFFESQMGDGTPARAYRTGDLGRIDASGLLHCEGRLDSLVKLNGFRIELGEVEGALEALPQVQQAVVVPATKDGRVRSLCAFVVLAAGGQKGEKPGAPGEKPGVPRDALALSRELKAELARSLPAYMVPRQVRVLERMPLNANGKADRRSLAASVSR